MKNLRDFLEIFDNSQERDKLDPKKVDTFFYLLSKRIKVHLIYKPNTFGANLLYN